ncbi:MAG: hypothetical protein ACJ8LG_10780 [Massilia sp.]
MQEAATYNSTVQKREVESFQVDAAPVVDSATRLIQVLDAHPAGGLIFLLIIVAVGLVRRARKEH